MVKLLNASCIWLTLLFVAGCTLIERPTPVERTSDYLVINVHVVDVETGNVLKTQQVEVKGGRISQMGENVFGIGGGRYKGQIFDGFPARPRLRSE